MMEESKINPPQEIRTNVERWFINLPLENRARAELDRTTARLKTEQVRAARKRSPAVTDPPKKRDNERKDASEDIPRSMERSRGRRWAGVLPLHHT